MNGTEKRSSPAAIDPSPSASEPLRRSDNRISNGADEQSKRCGRFFQWPRPDITPTGYNRLVVAAAVTLLAVAATVGAARAAPPLKHTAWAKITAAYTAQAKAHGATAACTPWDPTGIRQMTCDFGAKGRATVDQVGQPCSYAVTVYFPKPRFPLYEHSEIVFCGARWWTRPLPAPWTFSPR